MPPRNGRSATRSSNRHRAKGKEPQTTTSSAPPTSSSAPVSPSPSHSELLPPANQNKPSSETVSSPSPSSNDITLLSPSEALTDKNQSSIDEWSVLSQVQVSPSSVDNVRATIEVGDNEGAMNTFTPLLPTTPTDLMTQGTAFQTFQTPHDYPNTSPPSKTSHKADDPFYSVPSDPWHLTYTELRAIRLEFAQQLQAISTRTASTESKVSSNTGQIKEMGEQINTLKDSLHLQQQKTDANVSENSSKIQELGEQIQTLKNTIGSQQQMIQDLKKMKQDFTKTKDEFTRSSKKNISEMNKLLDLQRQQEHTIDSQQQTIKEMQKVKQDFDKTKEDFSRSSTKSISEMNKLLEKQRQQVHTLRDIRKDISHDAQKQKDELQSFKSIHTDIQKDVQNQFKHLAEDKAFKELKDQAFKNRYNILITGLPENESYDDYSVASHFSRLN